jgi:hypothetical protein
VRKFAGAVVLQPILRIEARTQRAHRIADGDLIGGEREVHSGVSKPGVGRSLDHPSFVTPRAASCSISRSV